jgi:hypothetical protein
MKQVCYVTIYKILEAIYMRSKSSVTTGTGTYYMQMAAKFTLTANRSFSSVLLIILRFRQEHKHI